MNTKHLINILAANSKGLFLACRADRLIPMKLCKFLGQAADLSRWIAKHKKECSNDFYTFKRNYQQREQQYERIINEQGLNEIDYLEFGVAAGVSFCWWVNRMQNPASRFYGFDTFTGLPEDWGPFRAGDMGTSHQKPIIPGDRRHQFYQGLFQQTLIPFLSSYKPGKRLVIHMDADIYSATLYVLTLLTPYLKTGDIIFFDEFNVPMHEFKAFTEWTRSFYISYKVLGGVNNFYQTAFMLV